MPTIDSYKHVFPLVGGAQLAGQNVLMVSEVYGTAFSIGGDNWLTAGHVLKSAASQPVMGLGFVDGSAWLFRSFTRYEIHDSHDIGVFQVDGVTATALPWIIEELPLATGVLSAGFPYALNPALMSLSVRVFRGTVVGAVSTADLLGRPRIYELQFQCPRGLSGAPLVSESSRLLNAGVVIGNATTQMMVFSDKEVLTEGTTTIVERYEMLHLGIAVQAGALVPLHFDLLRGTLGVHLTSHGLL